MARASLQWKLRSRSRALFLSTYVPTQCFLEDYVVPLFVGDSCRDVISKLGRTRQTGVVLRQNEDWMTLVTRCRSDSEKTKVAFVRVKYSFLFACNYGDYCYWQVKYLQNGPEHAWDGLRDKTSEARYKLDGIKISSLVSNIKFYLKAFAGRGGHEISHGTAEFR